MPKQSKREMDPIYIRYPKMGIAPTVEDVLKLLSDTQERLKSKE